MQTYILIFRSKALQLPDEKYSSDVRVSENTNLYFTRGPIEYGFLHRASSPVTIVGSVGDEVLKAYPATATFPEGENYIGIKITVPKGQDQDFLEREIGMAITVTTLLLGTSHFLECLHESWLSLPDQGQQVFTIHPANISQYEQNTFVERYKRVNEHLHYRSDEQKNRVALMARWYSKAIRVLENTEDSFLYFWTVLEITIEGRSPFTRLLLDYLQSNLLPQYSQDEINVALKIGRMHGIRSRLFHIGYLEWATHERGKKFRRINDICSEILRFELGITMNNDLEKYFEGAA